MSNLETVLRVIHSPVETEAPVKPLPHWEFATLLALVAFTGCAILLGCYRWLV